MDNSKLHDLVDECIKLGANKAHIQNFLEKTHYKLLTGGNASKEWALELLSIFEEIGDSLNLFSQQDIVEMCKRDFPNKYKTMPKSHLYRRIESLGYEEYVNNITGKTHYKKADETTEK